MCISDTLLAMYAATSEDPDEAIPIRCCCATPQQQLHGASPTATSSQNPTEASPKSPHRACGGQGLH